MVCLFAPFAALGGEACDHSDGYRAGLGPKVPLPSGPHQNSAHLVKPPHLRLEEEAWLNIHLDELVAKGVISPIFPGEQPQCVTPLILVLGI